MTDGMRGARVGRMLGEPPELKVKRPTHRGDPLPNPWPYRRAWAVAARRRRGESLRRIAFDYGVSHETVRKWSELAPDSYVEAQALDGNDCFQ